MQTELKNLSDYVIFRAGFKNGSVCKFTSNNSIEIEHVKFENIKFEIVGDLVVGGTDLVILRNRNGAVYIVPSFLLSDERVYKGKGLSYIAGDENVLITMKKPITIFDRNGETIVTDTVSVKHSRETDVYCDGWANTIICSPVTEDSDHGLTQHRINFTKDFGDFSDVEYISTPDFGGYYLVNENGEYLVDSGLTKDEICFHPNPNVALKLNNIYDHAIKELKLYISDYEIRRDDRDIVDIFVQIAKTTRVIHSKNEEYNGIVEIDGYKHKSFFRDFVINTEIKAWGIMEDNPCLNDYSYSLLSMFCESYLFKYRQPDYDIFKEVILCDSREIDEYIEKNNIDVISVTHYRKTILTFENSTDKTLFLLSSGISDLNFLNLERVVMVAKAIFLDDAVHS